MSEPLKHIKSIEVGDPCQERSVFCKYEIWIDFDDGSCESELVNVEDVLNRVNEWNFCTVVGGALGKDRIKDSKLGLTFEWPNAFEMEDNPQKVVGFQLFYYDVHGVKHGTKLFHFS